jgi:cation diffusion facilitator family transporter
MDSGKQATIIGIFANAVLFSIKLVAGLFSGSLSLLSDAVNSFSDTVYSIAIFISVRISRQKADADHPFGHHRAEPVAGLLVAMMTAILGFEIVKNGIVGLMHPINSVFSLFAISVLAVSMMLKSGMWLYFKKVAKDINSPAISAASVDSRNDILISFIALIGVSGSVIGFPPWIVI